MSHGFVKTSVAIVLLAVASLSAQAQTPLNQIGGKPPAPAPKAAPPPALPGAVTPSSAVPSSRPSIDMDPNDALFDAINRGDIGAARDAISRGADLRGHNLLGMTPIELSIDLGRNDISFMLLSMRGGDDGQARQAPAADRTAKPASKQQAKQVPPRPAARVAASAPAPSQSARLFGGDGGAPNPNAGFLGFDSSRR